MSILDNKFNKRINKMRHDFSYCDIDGLQRWNNPQGKTERLIITEIKSKNEKYSSTQLESLFQMERLINWDLLDEMSGVFVFKGLDDDFNTISVNKIVKSEKVFVTKHICQMTFNEVYNWFSHKTCRDLQGTRIYNMKNFGTGCSAPEKENYLKAIEISNKKHRRQINQETSIIPEHPLLKKEEVQTTEEEWNETVFTGQSFFIKKGETL